MSKRRSSKKSTSNQGILATIGVIIVALVGLGGYFITQSKNQTNTPDVPTVSSDAPVPDDNEKLAEDTGRDNETADANSTPVSIGSDGSVKNDWYELHFTSPIYPDNPKNHTGGLDSYLVKLIDKATKTLDVADYDFDLADVADAMVRAKQRGVVVRMVTDSDTINNVKNKPVQDAFDKLKKAQIPFIGDNRGPIMHNKFTVVDKRYIQTGSWNYTDGDTYHLNNNMIIIDNEQLAQNYTVEFEKMFVSKTFGPNKAKGVPNPVLTIKGVHVENYFAAEDGVVNHILDTIKTAKKSVYFLAFSFTQDDIGKAIEDKAKAGLAVGGVFETTGSNTPYSEYGKMKKAGLDVYTDGNPWVMHHKVIIIDEQTVIFGSFNFSDNANTQNDENILIINDPVLAKAFKAEYDRVLAVAKNPPKKKK
jgi:phosphatidylserine/phosphatidylglycerophosphate/cardiolipin synthase-like enzyme